MKKPNIVIVIPCWGRTNVFRLVCKQLDIFYSKTIDKIDLTVLYIFSRNDIALQTIEYIYQIADHKRDFIFSENEMLGKKLNDGIEYAAKFDYDYIMNFGSDDLIHHSLIDMYLPLIKVNTPIFGVNKLYFYEKGLHPVFFSYYNQPHLVGAGRMIHRQVIDKVTEKHEGLYPPDIKRGMDTMSAMRMISCGFKQTTVDPGTFPMIVDIKSEVNINSFKSVALNYHHNNTSFLSKIDVLFEEFEVLKTYR